MRAADLDTTPKNCLRLFSEDGARPLAPANNVKAATVVVLNFMVPLVVLVLSCRRRRRRLCYSGGSCCCSTLFDVLPFLCVLS